jgi:hypothetical protein
MGGQNAVPAEDHERGSFAVIAAYGSPLHNTETLGRKTK